jgi:HAD superfamily hydrolase (TIGR01458 family)
MAMLHRKLADRSLLIDLDGVVYEGDHLVEGALDCLDWVKQNHIPHLYVTNTTSRSRAALLDKFIGLGFEAQLEELMTPIVAANQWLEARQIKKIAAFVTPSAITDFTGVEIVPAGSDTVVEAIVIGDLGDAWDYRLLNSAFRLLMQEPGPQLIALGMTRYWRGADGLRLDVAPFVKALEHAASCEARVVGKPAAAFFAASLALLDCTAEQAYMIGDDIVGDIDAAQACGIRGIQVRTGKFRDADLNGEIRPQAVLDSIADLPSWWEQTFSGSV